MAEGGNPSDVVAVDGDFEQIERDSEQRVLSSRIILTQRGTGEPRVVVNNAQNVTTGDIHITNNYGKGSSKPKKSYAKKPLTVSTEVPSTSCLSYLSERLGGRWKQVGRALSFEDSTLDQIEHDNHQNSSERNYQMLRLWVDREGNDATKAVLSKHLAKCYLGKLCDYLTDDN